jgi:hypothetical protein
MGDSADDLLSLLSGPGPPNKVAKKVDTGVNMELAAGLPWMVL